LSAGLIGLFVTLKWVLIAANPDPKFCPAPDQRCFHKRFCKTFMENPMARVLITGGAGFIGSHMMRILLDSGHEAVGLDFFQQYIHPLQPTFLENMNYRFEVLLKDAKLERVNTLSVDSMRRVIASFKPTHVIHLAALPLANIAIRHPEEAFDTIIKGTVNMLEAMRDQKQLERFVFTSSSRSMATSRNRPCPRTAARSPRKFTAA